MGSEALLAARRSPANIVIDISAPQELTATGDLIDVARSGILPQTAETVPVSAPPPVLTVPDEPPEEVEEVFQDTPAESCQFQENFQRTAASQPYRQQPEYAAEPPVVYHRRSQKPLFMAIALTAVLLILICGGVYLLVFTLNSNSETPAAVKTAAVPPPQVQKTVTDEAKKEPPATAPVPKSTSGQPTDKNNNSDTKTANNNQHASTTGSESATEPPTDKNVANNNQSDPASKPKPEISELDPHYSWEHNSETLKDKGSKLENIRLGSGVKMVKIRTGIYSVELTPGNNKKSLDVGIPPASDKYVCTLTEGILTIEKTKGSNGLKMELELQFQGKNDFIPCPLYFKPGISYFRLGKPQADTVANTITVEIKKVPADFNKEKITVEPAADHIECDDKKITLTFKRAESANEKRLEYLRKSKDNIISQKNENIYKFVVDANGDREENRKAYKEKLDTYKKDCKDLIADIETVCKDIKKNAGTNHTLRDEIDKAIKGEKDERLFDQIAEWINMFTTKTPNMTEWLSVSTMVLGSDLISFFYM